MSDSDSELPDFEDSVDSDEEERVVEERAGLRDALVGGLAERLRATEEEGAEDNVSSVGCWDKLPDDAFID